MGRVTRDPNLELPVVETPADQLKEQDLQPFRAAIAGGVASVMTSHVAYPTLDSSRVPATLSREILQWLLRQQLKFDNLIVGDTMTLTAVLEGRTVAETVVLAVRGGCDVVLAPGDLEEALTALERAYDDGTLEPERASRGAWTAAAGGHDHRNGDCR